MPPASCCANPDLAWRQSRAAKGWADVFACRNCNHIHALETYAVPLRWPGYEHCVNCGGDFTGGADSLVCTTCGHSPEKDQAYHESLAAAHPERDFIAAALTASEAGRHVLALKLATGGARWGDQHTLARTLRLQAMVNLGLVDRALDEAWDWAKLGAPAAVYGVIAEMEITAENVPGAEKALRIGLDKDPTISTMWADLSELLHLQNEEGPALEASKGTLDDGETRDRGLAVIYEIAERLRTEGRQQDAMDALSYAGDYEAASLPHAWLHAVCAAEVDDKRRAVEWCEAVLKLDPAHAEAKSLLEKMQPQQKKGWFPWG